MAVYTAKSAGPVKSACVFEPVRPGGEPNVVSVAPVAVEDAGPAGFAVRVTEKSGRTGLIAVAPGREEFIIESRKIRGPVHVE